MKTAPGFTMRASPHEPQISKLTPPKTRQAQGEFRGKCEKCGLAVAQPGEGGTVASVDLCTEDLGRDHDPRILFSVPSIRPRLDHRAPPRLVR